MLPGFLEQRVQIWPLCWAVSVRAGVLGSVLNGTHDDSVGYIIKISKYLVESIGS